MSGQVDNHGMIRNFFRKKGETELNKNNEEQEAEIVDLGEERAQSETESQEATPSEKPASVEVDLKNKLLRLQADFDNFRKRSIAGKQEAREEARRELLLGLLPVYDNFLRAMGHAQEQEDYGSLHAGIQGIMQQMREFFQRHNLQEIPADAGTSFDPSRHDAVGTVPGNDENHDTVAQEVLKGFELNGYVIRPAQVLVFA
jgi:molecular chaperone GrpE